MGNDIIINVISTNQHFTSTFSMKACVTEWLTPQTLIWIWRSGVQSLVCRVFSLEKDLYPTLSLSTQVYKWVPATYYQAVTLQCTSISSGGGGGGNTPRHASCYGNWYKLRLFGPLACVRLYLLHLFSADI